MTNQTSETPPSDRQPEVDASGPAFAPPPAAYGVQASEPAQPPVAYDEAHPQPQEQVWTPEGLVATPALPPERVGHGALLALIAIPIGMVLSALIWKLGFIASISGIVVAGAAAVLYARGSGGRVKKGIPVIAAVIAIGIVGSFFAAVAVDLYDVFPQLDPEISAGYPSRAGFVSSNLFYPPVLKEYTRDIVLFVLFGVLGAFGTIIRLVRMNATPKR